MYNSATKKLLLVDWEVVGLGSGPQDCAQFCISHMYPAERKMWETQLINAYYKELTCCVGSRVSPEDYSLENCWTDYIYGGAERWVWLLALLTSMCPDIWVQYFHDQLADFLLHHGVTSNKIGMPRV
jgi:hypothetical protein